MSSNRGFLGEKQDSSGIHKPRVTGSSPVAAISFLAKDLRFCSSVVLVPVTSGLSLDGSSVLHLAQSVVKIEVANQFSHLPSRREASPTQVCDTGIKQSMHRQTVFASNAYRSMSVGSS
jgi:hypothetical protein